MRLTLNKNLAPLRTAAFARIDASAEQVRSHFITLGAGQSMVYQQKRIEAELVAADPDISPAVVPHIAAEAAAAGISLLDQAAVILSMAHMWQQASAIIEARRLSAKEAVRMANYPAAIEAAAHIDWADVETMAI